MTDYGIYLKTSTKEFISIAAAVGLNFVRLDLQHGIITPSDVSAMVTAGRTAGIKISARLPQHRRLVQAVLDLGVDSVTFPGVDTAAQADELVRWCRPAAVVVSVQIETTEGLANAAAIAAVDGIDILHCGRSDLATSLGLARQPGNRTQLDEAEDHVFAAALRAGKGTAVHWPPGNDDIARVQRLVAAGITLVTLGADTQILKTAFSHRLFLASTPAPSGVAIGTHSASATY